MALVKISARLTNQSHAPRIKANSHAALGKVLVKVVLRASQAKEPIGADASEPPTLREIAAQMLKKQSLFFPFRTVGFPQ